MYELYDDLQWKWSTINHEMNTFFYLVLMKINSKDIKIYIIDDLDITFN